MPKKSTESFIESIQPPKSSLDESVDKLKRKYGSQIVTPASQISQLETVSTGNLFIDQIFGTPGTGGIPCGRITEIYGSESSGKTSLALQTIAQVQSNDGVAAFIDAEHTFNPKLALSLGVNLDQLLISRPESAEEALDAIIQLVRSKSIDVLTLDSVAALVTEKEHEGGDSDGLSLPAFLAEKIKILVNDAKQSNSAVIFLNQERVRKEKFGRVSFDSPGGKALRHAATIRAKIEKKADIKNSSNEIIGNRAKIHIVKNKVAPAHSEIETDFIHGKGFLGENSHLFDWAVEEGIIVKKGAWHYLAKQPTLFQNSDQAILSEGTWSFLQDAMKTTTSDPNQEMIRLENGRTQSIQALEEMEGVIEGLREHFISQSIQGQTPSK